MPLNNNSLLLKKNGMFKDDQELKHIVEKGLVVELLL